MRPGLVVAAALLVACGSEKKTEKSEKTEAAAQDAKQAAIENARKAGVLDAEKAPSRVGPANAWWNTSTPCPAPTRLQIDDKGSLRDIACIGADGVKEGRSVSWNVAMNKMMAEGSYRAGKLDGRQVTYVGGHKLFEETYRAGVLEGPYAVYTAGGTVGMRGQHEGGKKSGVWTELDTKGTVKATMPYRDGKEDGTWSGVDPTGGAWDITFADGVVTKVSLKRKGVVVPSSNLAGDELCNRMVARVRDAASNTQKLMPDTERYLYISCRARLRTEVDCFVNAKDVAAAQRCITPAR